jgi:hypothetical protein
MTQVRRHHKIKVKTNIIHLAMLPMALVAGFAWIYFAYGVCDEAAVGAMSACGLFQVVPFLPTVVGLVIGAFIVWDLIQTGRDLHHEEHGTRPKHHLKHARRGYHALDENHRRHVHFAAIHVALVTLAVLAWFLYKMHSSTH